MTAKERSIHLMQEFEKQGVTDLFDFKTEKIIREAITAAIEEERSERYRLEKVSGWLKERREACLEGGMSLQQAHDDCLHTMLRAYQEIDAYLEGVKK